MVSASPIASLLPAPELLPARPGCPYHPILLLARSRLPGFGVIAVLGYGAVPLGCRHQT